MGSRRQVEDPTDSKRLRALERSLVRPATGGDVRVHLAYPNNYWVAMSNLGFQAVYGILAAQSGVAIERAFLPEEAYDAKVFERPWRTFESSETLAACDVLAFSMSFETDYPHLLRMLRNAKLLTSDPEVRSRRADESRFVQPLILVGGTGVTLNPEPIADFVDVVFLGESEEFLSEFVEALRKARSTGSSRTDTLRALTALEGVYVPRFAKPVYSSAGPIVSYARGGDELRKPARRIVKDLSKFPTYSQVLTSETEFRSMFLTETGRGCEMGCRFCVAGYIYRPVRKRSEESIADTVKIGLEQSDSVGFVGAAVSSHRAIAKLTSSVAAQGARASLSSIMSQRVTRELAASLSESEYKTVALAPEAGSERLRRAAGKRVTNDQVIEAARALAEAGIRGFKLYFIVGLPTEVDEDVRAIAELAGDVQSAVLEASRDSGNAAWIVLSVNPFIPKASTPFQWEPMLDERELDRKILLIRKLARRIPNVQMNVESPKESYFQALLSRGDRRVGRYLMAAEERGENWKYALQIARKGRFEDVPDLDFFARRRIPFGEFLPWDAIDSRIDKGLLMREALRAYHGEEFGHAASAENEALLVPDVPRISDEQRV